METLMRAPVVYAVGFALALIGLYTVRRESRVRTWGTVALLVLLFTQVTAILMSPPERDMGDLQKIIYVHVPSAWMSLLGFGIIFVASLLYLWKRDERYDRIGVATAEAGVVFTALSLLQGMIWGKPTWGVAWTWDPRLTSQAVSLVMYVGYLSLRAFTDEEERRARWSATVGILGFINANIVYMSVRWWRTLHQVQSTPETMSPEYVFGMRINAYAFLYVLIWFIAHRYYTARMERDADERVEEQALAGGPAHV
jgi:heme exporter protein C